MANLFVLNAVSPGLIIPRVSPCNYFFLWRLVVPFNADLAKTTFCHTYGMSAQLFLFDYSLSSSSLPLLNRSVLLLLDSAYLVSCVCSSEI